MSIKTLEKSLKADKKRYEEEMDAQILTKVSSIVDAFAAEAQAGSYQHGAYLIDRVFGKARQTVGLDGGEAGAPIIFMPTTLVQKFALDKPIEAEKIEEPNVYESKEK